MGYANYVTEGGEIENFGPLDFYTEFDSFAHFSHKFDDGERWDLNIWETHGPEILIPCTAP